MYKVLVADDEPAIREGLRTIVDWNAYGFQVVGDAGSGRDAVAKHEALALDLIVIDIRMPGMDGLQAIGEIRKKDAGCRFLILSGYADFNYAREAIVHGVDGYILKPLDEEELERELVRVRAQLDRESATALRKEQGTALRRKELILALLEGGGTGAAEGGIQDELRKLLSPQTVRPDVYQIVLAELSPAADSGTGVSAWADSVRKRWSEIVEDTGRGYLFDTGPYLGILLLEDISRPVRRKELARLLADGTEGHVMFTAAAGEAVRKLAGLRLSYDSALSQMKRSFMLQPGEIHTGGPSGREREEPPGAEPAAAVAEAKVDGEEPDLDVLAGRLCYAVDLGSRDGVAEALREAGGRIAAYDCSADYVKRSFGHMLAVLLNKVSVAHGREAVHDMLPLIPELYRQNHYGGLLELTEARLGELCFRLGNGSSAPVMKQMLDFIGRHYHENLKLETLAELFKYNSGYLGKMFKQHTGVSFNTYLDKVRIRRAIELLADGMKVHQAAARVGYANVDYFHSKFKKYIGQSPSSFKGSPDKALQALEERMGGKDA